MLLNLRHTWIADLANMTHDLGDGSVLNFEATSPPLLQLDLCLLLLPLSPSTLASACGHACCEDTGSPKLLPLPYSPTKKVVVQIRLTGASAKMHSVMSEGAVCRAKSESKGRERGGGSPLEVDGG